MHVIITRTPDDAPRLTESLQHAGLLTYHVPLKQRLSHTEVVERAIASHPRPYRILVTSPGAVKDQTAERLATWHHIPTVAVGPGTARALKMVGFTHVQVATPHVGEAAVAALGPISDKPVVWLRGQEVIAHTGLLLAASGCQLIPVVSYSMTPHPDAAHQLASLTPPALITLTSPGFAYAWQRLAQHTPWLNAPVAAIGPTTAHAARELGLHVVAEANPYTFDAFVDAIVSYARRAAVSP